MVLFLMVKVISYHITRPIYGIILFSVSYFFIRVHSERVRLIYAQLKKRLMLIVERHLAYNLLSYNECIWSKVVRSLEN